MFPFETVPRYIIYRLISNMIELELNLRMNVTRKPLLKPNL